MAICGICQKEDSKYKCPGCAIPYCSLVCYKPHKAVHSTEQPPTAAATPQPPPPPPPQPAVSEPGIPKDGDPLAAVVASPAVKQLLLSPTLRTHLLDVYATAQQTSAGNGNGNGNGNFNARVRGQGRSGGWTEEIGDKAAADVLQRLRDDGNVEVEEFVRVIVGMMRE